MKRKVLGFVAAVLLTIAGTAVLVAYVRGAEDRALAGEETTEIYVVAKQIKRGAPAENLEERVRVETVPAKVRVADAVGDLAELEGLVASIDLLPGEQLTRSRFIVPAALESDIRARIEVPEDKVAVTVQLSPERAFGGGLVPGQDKVAVIASFDPFKVELPELPDGSEAVIELDGTLFTGTNSATTTGTILRGIEVLDVVPVEAVQQTEDEDGNPVVEAPQDDLLVTLALDLASAERLIFTAEFGTNDREAPGGIWLALDGDNVEDAGSQIWTRANIYDPSQPPAAGLTPAQPVAAATEPS
ncbi:MAG: RcpC/CpaB family pilus assembly protein [Acidimicrobiia bacterium]|nr:RcpC/CpaB family pilus assembly protein [Acidimicrobiia bacterium]